MARNRFTEDYKPQTHADCCPRCGSQKAVVHKETGYLPRYRVRCSVCKYQPSFDWFYKEDDAIRNWNQLDRSQAPKDSLVILLNEMMLAYTDNFDSMVRPTSKYALLESYAAEIRKLCADEAQ